jgi:hypothetical protein
MDCSFGLLFRFSGMPGFEGEKAYVWYYLLVWQCRRKKPGGENRFLTGKRQQLTGGG